MYVDQAFARNAALTASGPTAEAIRLQVERVCTSAGFANSERLKRFLRFIVEEAIQGRSDRLKAYTVALAVFDRPPTFDPQTDPIVRIEAGRLRRALDHHYLTDGCDDPVLIIVPKGCYIPRFEWRTAEPASLVLRSVETQETRRAPDPGSRGIWFRKRQLGWVAACGLVVALAMAGAGLVLRDRDGAPAPVDPFVLVLPFTASGGESDAPFAAGGLTGSLIDTLASRIRVMGQETTRLARGELPLAVLRRDYGLTHVLEGTVTAQAGLLTVSTRLVDVNTNAIVWVMRYDRISPASVADVEADIGAKVLATLSPAGRALAAGINARDGETSARAAGIPAAGPPRPPGTAAASSRM